LELQRGREFLYQLLGEHAHTDIENLLFMIWDAIALFLILLISWIGGGLISQH
jgi:hypothetical protein